MILKGCFVQPFICIYYEAKKKRRTDICKKRKKDQTPSFQRGFFASFLDGSRFFYSIRFGTYIR